MYCEKCNKNNIMSEVVLHLNTEDLTVNNTECPCSTGSLVSKLHPVFLCSSLNCLLLTEPGLDLV